MKDLQVTIDVKPDPRKQVLDLLEQITAHGPIGMDGNDPYKECKKCRSKIDRAIRILKREINK